MIALLARFKLWTFSCFPLQKNVKSPNLTQTEIENSDRKSLTFLFRTRRRFTFKTNELKGELTPFRR